MTVTISERSILLDGWRWLLSGVPAGLVRLIEGRVSSVRLPAPSLAERRQRIRLLLGPELVLSRRLRLPVAARSDLAGAIRLLIETETPFAADELIVHAERLATAGETREAIYQVRMVPRAALLATAAERGMRPGQIVGIADEAAPDRTDFWSAAFPVRAALRWTFFAPILVVAACVGLLLADTHGQRESQLAGLNDAVSERLIQLRQATDELDARRKEQMGSAELAATLSASASAFNMLGQLRVNLPPEVQVQRLEFGGQALRLSVRATDSLAVARHLGTTMSAQIDGAITVDPASGLEQATIRILQAAGGDR